MDNQPFGPAQPNNQPDNQPDNQLNTQPTPQPIQTPTGQPVMSADPTSPMSPTQPVPPAQPMTNPGNYTNPSIPVNTATGDIIPAGAKANKKKGLIAAIICLVVALLAGGGFAAAYMVANQPENILASSLNNLLSAEQISVNGTVDLNIANGETIGVNSVTLNFDADSAQSGQATTASISANLADGTTTSPVNIGEVFLADGVLYLEADGIKDFYYNNVYDYAQNILTQNTAYQSQSQAYANCVLQATDQTESENCDVAYAAEVSTDDGTTAAVDQTLNQIGEVVESLDGQWLKISIDDVVNSDMLADFINPATKQQVIDAYGCTIDRFNNFGSYSDEFTSIYDQYPFLSMAATQDGFYDIDFNAEYLTGYINTLPSTTFTIDLMACYSDSYDPSSVYETSVSYISSVVEGLPQISAKFDGIFNHHLTELKVSANESDYTLNSDLKFSYPSNLTISTPDNARPVMEVVEEIYQKFESIQEYYTLYL